MTRGLRAYTLVLRPQHWLFSQRLDRRIWLDKTSVEVAQILMGGHGHLSPVTAGIITPPPSSAVRRIAFPKPSEISGGEEGAAADITSAR